MSLQYCNSALRSAFVAFSTSLLGKSIRIFSPTYGVWVLDDREKNEWSWTYSARLCSWLDWVPEHPRWVLKPSQISHQTLTLPFKIGCKREVKNENFKEPEEVVDILESVGVCYLNHRTWSVILRFHWRMPPPKIFANHTCGKGVTSAHSGLSE